MWSAWRLLPVLKPSLVDNLQVHVVVPWVEKTKPFGNLAAVFAQVIILVDERVECCCLCCCRRSYDAIAICDVRKHDLVWISGIARDVDQVVTSLSVSVDVARIDEGVAVAAGNNESVTFSGFEEQAEAGLIILIPVLVVRHATHDTMALAKLRVR